MRLEHQRDKNFYREITLLKSFMIGAAGRDPEGDYHPEFAKRVLEAVEEKPLHRFISPRDFLKKMHS